MLNSKLCHSERSEESRGSVATRAADPSATPQDDKEKRKIKIAAIHGRMPEKELIRIMDDFDAKKIDILVATTIIENGLDFPNVNTLVVANATRLGLAQAYQIRGRIGRSHQQA